jgi:hypothetical protein
LRRLTFAAVESILVDLKNLFQRETKFIQRETNSQRSRTRDGICGNVIQSSAHRIIRQLSCCALTGKETIMANVSKVILAAVIAAVSIASPALAAHKSKPTHQNGYVAQSRQGSGVRAFASVPRLTNPDTGRPYPAGDRTTPFSGGGF